MRQKNHFSPLPASKFAKYRLRVPSGKSLYFANLEGGRGEKKEEKEEREEPGPAGARAKKGPKKGPKPKK